MIFTKLLTLCLMAATVLPSLAGPVPSDMINYRRHLGFLKRYGYLSRNGPYSNDEIREALRLFQKNAGIQVTGEYDLQSETMMNTPRCGRMDTGLDPNEFVLTNTGWGHTDLTYRVDQYPDPTELPKALVDDTVAQAFKFWSDVSPLTFQQKSRGVVDIVIIFASGSHGDGYQFDGPGGTLAHAFEPYTGPQTVDSIYGDAHFDDSETWTLNIDSGTNFLQVATHEFGHSLGISHSDNRNAIMFPYYGGYDKDFKLLSDDIQAIQALYGPPDKGTTKSPTQGTTKSSPTTPPSTSIATTAESDVSTRQPPYSCSQTGFTEFEGVKRRGGKQMPEISTFEGCRAMCERSAICWAFSYFEGNRGRAGRCFIHNLVLTFSKGTDFFFKKYNADGMTYYEVSTQTEHKGGLPVNEQVTIEECEDMCDSEEHCIGYTYRRNTNERQRWWCNLHIFATQGNSKSNKKPGKKPKKSNKFSHYVKYGC